MSPCCSNTDDTLGCLASPHALRCVRLSCLPESLIIFCALTVCFCFTSSRSEAQAVIRNFTLSTITSDNELEQMRLHLSLSLTRFLSFSLSCCVSVITRPHTLPAYLLVCLDPPRVLTIIVSLHKQKHIDAVQRKLQLIRGSRLGWDPKRKKKVFALCVFVLLTCACVCVSDLPGLRR